MSGSVRGIAVAFAFQQASLRKLEGRARGAGALGGF